MTSCCLCFDLTATIALLSCDNCRICSSCYQDLLAEFTNTTGISPLRCQCPNQRTIIVNTNPSVTPSHHSHDSAQTYRHSLTKTLKGLTNLSRKLQIFMSLHQQRDKLAPKRIRAMLKVQVSYLPINLVYQRAEELSKQLNWYNDSQIKAIQLEITAVSEWIVVHNNLLAGVNGMNTVNTSHTHQAYYHYTQNLRPLVVTAIKKAEAVQHIEKYGVVVYQELSPIDLNKVGAVVQLFNNNTGTGYIIETKRQCGQYLNIRAYHDDYKVGRWQIISKAGFRDQFYNNDKLIAKVTVSDCRLSKYGSKTCSLRQYWPRQRFYCSILPPPEVRSEDSEKAPCLRSYNIKNGCLDGWCYLMSGTVNDLVIVQDGAVGTLRGKVSGLYNEGVLVEAMD